MRHISQPPHTLDPQESVNTHHKAKPVFQVNLSDSSVSFEELLHISFPSMRAQTADEHATSTHVDKIQGNLGIEGERTVKSTVWQRVLYTAGKSICAPPCWSHAA